jgi:hypothetical protein
MSTRLTARDEKLVGVAARRPHPDTLIAFGEAQPGEEEPEPNPVHADR